MWNVLQVRLVFSLLLLTIAHGEARTIRGLRGQTTSSSVDASNSTNNCLVCNVGSLDIQFKPGYFAEHDEYLVCETDAEDEPDGAANQFYLLDDLPKDFTEKHKDTLREGESRICIPHGKTDRETRKIKIAKGAPVPKLLGKRKDHDDHHHHRRQLMKTKGTHKVLAVIISSNVTGEHDPNVNATTLAGNLFGLGKMPQKASVAAQYHLCSNGKLKLVPYKNTHVKNGVLSVKVPIAIAGTPTLSTLQNAVVRATQKALKVNKLQYEANHIVFCLPQGSLINGTDMWVSYGYTNGVMSFYQYSMCIRLSAPMHEMGHNNGFYHSGVGTDQYGDRAGYMGYAYQQTGHPRMCFNAQKNYLSGWFDDRKVSVNPVSHGAWNGTLIAPVDYSAASGKLSKAVVVVNVGRLYLQLNSAKKFNNETKKDINKVHIVSADIPSRTSSLSWWQAGLGSGESFTYANFTNTGVALVIKVCSIHFGSIDTAKISIYLKNGVQKSKC